ncbi:MAG TPA: conjugal transfer protein TraF, partial [Vicinamibacterales bacterium]|nr:conjugal transfer protein TraF [Vicinamibacterales bacterium]
MRNVSRPLVSFLTVSLFIVLSALTFAVPPACAQPTDVIGVRAQGMGGAFTAVADDATAWWWNPAGLGGGPFFNGLFEFGRPDTSSSRSVRGISVAYPALGLTYYRLPLRQIRLSTSTESLATIRQGDEAALTVFGATVGQSFGNHLVLGSTLKLLHADGTNVGLDAGAMATFGRARLGVTVRDLTKPSFGSGTGAYTLDRSARAGLALSSGRRGVIGSATLSFDADLTTA